MMILNAVYVSIWQEHTVNVVDKILKYTQGKRILIYWMEIAVYRNSERQREKCNNERMQHATKTDKKNLCPNPIKYFTT